MVIGNLKKGSKSSCFFFFFFNVNTAGFKSCCDVSPTTKALERGPLHLNSNPLTGYCLANPACLLYSELTKRHCDSRDYQPTRI